MIWGSSGSANINFGYRPIAKRRITWKKNSDGNWYGYDFGTTYDSYEADVTLRGPLSDIGNALDEIITSHEEFNLTCGAGEEIFGPEIDYSSPVTVAVTDYGQERRDSFGIYSKNLRLRLISPSFQSTTPSLDGLRPDGFSWIQNPDIENQKAFTYSGVGHYADNYRSTGIFDATFVHSTAEYIPIRRYLMTTNRTSAITYGDLFSNIQYPFGYSLTGSFTAKIIEFEDLGRDDLLRWRFRLRMAKVI